MAKVALLIGVSEYEPGLNPLPSAVKDVEAMQQVLQRPEIGEFADTDVTLLKNPNRSTMEEAIETLFAGRQKDDLVLLFFSGHGIKDDTGRLYLATRTTRKTPKGDLIRSSALPASVVHENMSRSRSKRQVVILDSCFSGAFAEGLLAKDDGTINIREQLGGEGRAVLTSSSSTEYSFEEQGSDLSVYTRYLIEGITTGAADLDDDGVVSIDELHEYASRKVREIQPAMKPEIYAIREGFKIRLTKVPPGDPKQKYRKEVTRYINRGEVSFVGRQTLNVLRNRLALSEAEATTIEDEILAVARLEFRKKLQEYEQAFTNALQNEATLSEEDLNTLRQNLQYLLGLRNEDTIPIEAQVRAQIETYARHLQQYEQELAEGMRQEYPLSQATRHRLEQMQQEWQLTNGDLAAIENRITAEIKVYRQKLQQYEQEFTRATQQEYPLSETQRNELRQFQQVLGLKDGDIALIETQIMALIEANQQKLQQYEQVLNQVIQHEYPISDESREDLRRYQQALELSEEEIARIEERVFKNRTVQQRQQPVPQLTNQPVEAQKQIVKPQPSITPANSTIIWVIGYVGVFATVAFVVNLLQSTPPQNLPDNPLSTPSESNSVSSAKLDLSGNVSLNGAGATFPAILYQNWFQALNKKYPNLQVNYNANGSGAGIENFTKNLVDFGASDVAMTDAEISKVQQGVILLPMTAGGIVLAYNLPGVQQLKLPRDVYSGIFLGTIKTWNDPKITAANSGVNLPNRPITIIHRSDGSGTTGAFTQHLSGISPDWKTKVGSGKTVNWPVGVGAPKNDGVTAQIKRTQGAIGYVEYTYAQQNKLNMAALQNKAGQFVVPDQYSVAKALESEPLPANLRVFITNPTGAGSYPISTYTWILAYKRYADKAKAKAMEAMIEYGLTEGQKVAPQLGYVPLPADVVQKVATAADAISPDYKISVSH